MSYNAAIMIGLCEY